MSSKKHHNFKLEDTEKQLPFQAPENFFENFQKEVLEKIEASEEKPETTIKPIQHNSGKFYFGIAAGISIVLMSAFLVFQSLNKPKSEDVEALIAQLSDEEIVAYLETSDIEYSEIGGYLSNEDLDQMDDALSLDDFKSDDAEALIEYYSL